MSLFRRYRKISEVEDIDEKIKESNENDKMSLEDTYFRQFRVIDDTVQEKISKPLDTPRHPKHYINEVNDMNDIDDMDDMDDMDENVKSDEWNNSSHSEKLKSLNEELDNYWKEYNLFKSFNKLYKKVNDKVNYNVNDYSSENMEDSSQLTKYFVISYCTTIQAMILAIFIHGLERVLNSIICNCEC